MLDQLVESKSNYESNTKRGGYLFTTAVLVFSLFASGILWSLFAKNLEMGGEGLELSSIVPPVPMPETAPPPPEPLQQVKQNATDVKVDNSLPTRQVNMAKVDEPFIPKDVSITPNTFKARPNSPFTIGKADSDPAGLPSGRREGTNVGSSQAITVKPRVIDNTEKDDVPPPVIAKKPVEPEVKKPDQPKIIRSSGVLNGKAISLPKPPYPAAAKAIRASGDVNVQVTIDESGNVISANAISGHALLRQVSEQAARSAKFSPTKLGDQAVKVTGMIVYKFSPQ